MPEVLVGLLQQFWPYISGIFVFGAAGSYSVWGGTQSANGTPGGLLDTVWHAVRGVITSPAQVFGSLTGTAHKATRSAISHWALANEKTTAAWFTHLNVLARATFQSNLATANTAADAIATLSGRVNANARYRDGTTVKERATKALHTADTAILREHNLSTTFTRTHAAQVKLNVHYTHAIDVALPRDIGRIRTREEALSRDQAKLKERTTSLENGAIRTFEWIRAHPLTAVTGVFAGAVAIALQRLGYGFLRCRGWRSFASRLTCGMGTLLEELLFTAITAIAATDICDFANAAETLALEFQGTLFTLVDVENALVGCHGATAPPDLEYNALVLPPTNLGLALVG